MKYSLQKNNYKNFKIFRDNICEPRAYFIPFKTLEKAESTDIRQERYSSDMVTCLSGKWGFKFFQHSTRLPDVLDTAHTKFDEIDVPSTWQRTGYQEPVYLNCPYEFKTMFPGLPNDMPAAIYRKTFNIDDLNKEYILTFLGAATNIEVYLNCQYVGYSEGSHNTAEFNITDKLTEGENELIVLSYKWCCGSFLEAQDMFRENGIFRDVLLTAYEKSYIYDYSVKSVKNGDCYDMEVQVDVPSYSENSLVRVALKDGSETIATAEMKTTQKNTFDFKSLAVKEWNAEEPYLYTLLITLEEGGDEVMSLRSYQGFKTIEIKGNVFTFNGKKIKFKGVNHHDSNVYTGYVMTHEDIEKDIALIKKYNCNSVRTSHYPPDPFFLMLCDIYGLYVVDEADIETHGLWELCNNIDAISNDLKWRFHYVDRVSRMYKRDRNRTCVTMWSLGNEAGGHRCQDKCCDWLKKEGTPIPVHYEGVIRTKRVGYDVVSEMYTHQDEVKMIGEGKLKGRLVRTPTAKKNYLEKPFFLCEYAHAMGVGPGAMEEYWDLIYKHDNLMGGCIWEWSDHSVYHAPDDPKYPYRYTYGGDHKEKQHDGNFCVDGLMYPDRTPHTGALQMKEVYRPIKAQLVEDSTFKFTNTNRFRSSSYITIKWQLDKNGAAYQTGEMQLDILPEESIDATIDLKPIDKDNDYIITFSCFDGDEQLSAEQIILNDVKVTYAIKDSGKIIIESDSAVYTVKFDEGEAKFSAKTGTLISYMKNGHQYINTSPATGKIGFVPNIFRAPLDNDMNISKKWLELKMNKAEPALNSFEATVKGSCIALTASYTIKSGRAKFFDCVVEYTVSPAGEIKIRTALSKIIDETLNLPRFGMTVELPEEFSVVEYYGRGPGENLPDIKAQSLMGIYKNTVHNMHEPYIYPQDNSEHCGVKWLKITDNSGHAINVFAENSFAFNIHDYTQANLFEAKHQEDIVTVPSSILTIDGYIRGTGTNSCGPDTLPQYQIDENSLLVYEFTVVTE